MSALFSKRLQKNLQQNIKYLTLVFNDFFVLAIIFLLGGFLFWYAQTLQVIDDNLWYYKPLLALILFIPLTVGKLATFLEPADSQFIWTQDKQMLAYLKKARNYSMLVPTIIIVLVAGLAFPFATVKAGVNLLGFAGLFLGLILAKYNQLLVVAAAFYNGGRSRRASGMMLLLNLLGVALGVYLPGGSLVFEMVILGALIFVTKKGQQVSLDWNSAIEYEQKRREVVQGFYSLFTDIPDRPIKIKRRRYLDVLLTKVEKKPAPDFYLYQRTLLRNPEFLNLIVRMTAFALLLAFMIQDPKFVIALDSLIVFLTIYQLLPLYSQFDRNTMYRSLPIAGSSKNGAFLKVIAGVLVLQVVVIGIFWLAFLPNKIMLLMGVAIMVAISAIILFVYLPSRIKKLEQNANGRRVRRR